MIKFYKLTLLCSLFGVMTSFAYGDTFNPGDTRGYGFIMKNTTNSTISCSTYSIVYWANKPIQSAKMLTSFNVSPNSSYFEHLAFGSYSNGAINPLVSSPLLNITFECTNSILKSSFSFDVNIYYTNQFVSTNKYSDVTWEGIGNIYSHSFDLFNNMTLGNSTKNEAFPQDSGYEINKDDYDSADNNGLDSYKVCVNNNNDMEVVYPYSGSPDSGSGYNQNCGEYSWREVSVWNSWINH